MTLRKTPAALGTILILLAGTFWGSMGIFVRHLASYGFSPIQIASLRLSTAAVIFCLLLGRNPAQFRIRWRDIPLFLGLGLASILFFTVCYFSAIAIMPLSTAAILLYTSPIWVMLMSVMFFHERLTLRKLLALALAFTGCVLTAGISGGGLSVWGFLLGIGSGIGYGLYSILGTIALRRYRPLTVTAYTFLTAGLGSLFFCQPADMLGKAAAAPSVAMLALFVVLTALVTAVIPFLAYTSGLKSVEPSKAAILATVEPMVATLIGMAFFHEPLSAISAAGIALILGAIAVLNRR